MKRLILIAALCLAPTLTFAQAPPTVRLCNGTQPNCPLVSGSNPLPVSASVTATVAGFTANGNFATLTATASSSASTALPSASTTVRITNNGTSAVSCVLVTGAATATTSKILVQAGSSVSRVVGSFDHIACIDQSGSASNPVVVEGGSGLGNDSGGGGGSGGGGTSSAFDAAFPANGTAIGLSDATNMKFWATALALGDGVNGNNMGAVSPWWWNGTTWDRTSPIGLRADTACSTDNGTCALIALLKRTNQNLTTLNTTAGSPISAGTNVIGHVIADTGSTTAVTALPATPAGTNLIGYTSADPCAQQNVAKANVAISMQNTTTVKLVALASAKKIYICSLSLIASGATVFSIADGTKVTTECDTAAEAVMGAAVASHGLSLAANGGLSYGNGTGTVAFTTTAAHDLCLFQSGSVDLSGNLTYVQQ